MESSHGELGQCASIESWHWDRDRLREWQLRQLNSQLDAILPRNVFYSNKLRQAGWATTDRLKNLDELSGWPLTSKQELADNASQQASGISQHHSYPLHNYSRMHRTSGTTGTPLMILDTARDWQWWSDVWQHVLQSAAVGSDDRVFLAFSFGPFIGFWSAHQACVDRGAMVIPAGGLSTLARLDFLRQSAATVICCTPSYALHLAEVARAEEFPLADLPVRRLIVAGEAGGSLACVKQVIEDAWQSQVIDHAGATEIGPWGFGWPDCCGLHVIETNFIAEVLPLSSESSDYHTPPKAMTNSEELGELVLTSLGRYGAPVIRYRTGDVVSVNRNSPIISGRCNFLWLPDGILGRVDDMVTVRGVNIFPGSIEILVRQINGLGEYTVQVTRTSHLDQLTLTVEGSTEAAQQLQKLLDQKLSLRTEVQRVEPGTLPRSEGKSRRWHDLRNDR